MKSLVIYYKKLKITYTGRNTSYKEVVNCYNTYFYTNNNLI